MNKKDIFLKSDIEIIWRNLNYVSQFVNKVWRKISFE